jgi:hypothetical protein
MADTWLEIDEGREIKIVWVFAEDDGDETGGALGEGIKIWEHPSDKDPEEIEHYVASAAAREFATEESKNDDDGL